CSSYTSSST
nr:immunoglobulin light chain junction region [Homo sapiens]MCB25772.1 immunoglobulin light chain junction region [Homo sapiens]